MRKVYSNVPIGTLCGLFGRSRQAWYDHGKRYDGVSMQEGLILSWVNGIRADLPRVGGVKLLQILGPVLMEHNMHIGRDAFFVLLRNNGLLIQARKRYTTTTMSHHHFRKWPDLVQRRRAIMAEQIWVSDITYLRTASGFVYLFLITDAYSRKIVGYHLSQTLKASGCLIALEKAVNGRIYPKRPLLHHSDRGIQYCCEEYIEMLQQRGIGISMTQSGSPYDNAIAERVNGILKQEFGLYQVFKGYGQASAKVCEAIALYNNRRPHYSCDMKTPQQTHLLELQKTL
jgi:putative transposase